MEYLYQLPVVTVMQCNKKPPKILSGCSNMPSLFTPGDQLGDTWAELMIFTGLTYKPENLWAVGWPATGLGGSNPGLFHICHLPPGIGGPGQA